jgi:hypothetical protein
MLTSASPLTFVESLIGGHWSAEAFQDVQQFVMFIGQPRTGSSLTGSLLNAHRNMLVSQELNVLKYLRRGYGRRQLLWLIRRNEQLFARRKRRWTGYQYSVPDQWQGRCEKMLVIGDKKAGKSTEELRRDAGLLSRLEQTIGVPVRIVHIVRNPYNVITTIYRKTPVDSLQEAARRFFARCETNWQLKQERGEQIKTLRLEDLIDQPQRHMGDLCRFLHVEPHTDYLEDCAKVIFSRPRQPKSNIAWPAELVQSVSERMKAFPFLDGYHFDEGAAHAEQTGAAGQPTKLAA